GATVVYTPPVGTDGCSGATTALTAGLGSCAFLPVGTTVETYTVTDLSGNQAMCSFTITVTDDEAPAITCPEDLIVSNDPGDCGAVVTFAAPEALDNCDGAITTVQTGGPLSGDHLAVGVYPVEF